MENFLILTINPGSTSTKIGVFENDTCVLETTVRHSTKQIEEYSKIWDQYTFRKEEIIATLEKHDFQISKLHAVVGRGGLIKPVPGGTYHIDQSMIEDARAGIQGQHASNLGCVIAYSIGWELGIPSFIVDPPAVNDFEPLAKISGNKLIERGSLLHALNIFATARKYAKTINKDFRELNLIVAHMGGGITVAALRNGKAINVNNGLDEGPFTPERSGQLPLFAFMKLCMSGKYTEDELKKMVVGKGGLTSYFNTNKATDVEQMIVAGSHKYKLVYQAMAYQIAQEIGARATNLMGKVDAIILTGGVAHSTMLTGWISERVDFISQVKVFPGEEELQALAEGGLRVLRGEETARHYKRDIKRVGILYWDNMEVYVSAINMIEDKFKKAGYIFRKEDENLKIKYVNCKKQEEKVMPAIDKFRTDGVDVIFAIGSPISLRLGQYLRNDTIPVIFTGIYSPAVITDFDKEHNLNYYATCYSDGYEEHLGSTVFKIDEKTEKMGILYTRGEIQSEIQLDEFKEYCELKNIKVFAYDIQSYSDYSEAKNFFTKNKIKWVYFTTSTVVNSSANGDLKLITDNFMTVSILEDTVYDGCLIANVTPWLSVCNEAADLALKIFDKQTITKRVIIPKPKKLVANKETAEKLGVYEIISQLPEVKFID